MIEFRRDRREAVFVFVASKKQDAASNTRACTHKLRPVNNGWSMSALPPKAEPQALGTEAFFTFDCQHRRLTPVRSAARFRAASLYIECHCFPRPMECSNRGLSKCPLIAQLGLSGMSAR
jgi:hypothetical protein